MFGCLGRPIPSSARDLKRVLKAIPCSPMWGASNTRGPCRQAVESNIFARSYVLPLGALVYSTDCCRNTFLLMSTVCLQRQFSWTTVFLIEIRNGKHLGIWRPRRHRHCPQLDVREWLQVTSTIYNLIYRIVCAVETCSDHLEHVVLLVESGCKFMTRIIAMKTIATIHEK